MRDPGTAHVDRVAARRGTGWFDVACALAPAAFEADRDGVCIHRGGTLLYASPSFLRLMDLSTTAEVVGRQVLDLFVPRDRPLVALALDAAWSTALAQEAVAVRMERPRRGALPVEVIARRSVDATPPVEVLYVCMPTGESGQSADREGEPGSWSGRGSRESGPRPTVLICDDEARLGALTAGLLADYGFQSVTVGTGEDALRELSKAGRAVDVVLLDVNLSHGSSARDVLRKMRADGSSARVVLTSGLAEEDVDLELISHPSVVGYVAKPYAVEQLVRSIRTALMPRSA